MFSTRFIAPLAFIITLLLASFPSSSFAISIDDFSTDQTVPQVDAGAFSTSVSVSSNTVLGKRRSIRIEATAGDPNRFLATIVDSSNLAHAQGPTVEGYTQLHWDGDGNPSDVNPSGLGGIDLTQDSSTAFVLKNLFYDYPGNVDAQLILIVHNQNGVSASEYALTLDGSFPGNTDAVVPFANFAQSGGSTGLEDFQNVGAIELIIDGRNAIAADISVEAFTTNGNCPLFPDNQGSVLDECGECIPPSDPNYNKSCSDCLGVPNGTTLPGDMCDTGELGICEDGYYNDKCECEREFNPAVEKCDGVDNNCNGEIDETFPLLGDDCSVGEDECSVEGKYICDDDGDLTCDAVFDPADLEDCSPIIGCDGIPGSDLIFDRCGDCGGDGTSCDACDSLDITDTIFLLDGGAKEQEALIKNITRPLRRKGKARLREWAKDTRTTAHDLQIKNWVLSWTIPQVVLTCPDTEINCVEVSNEDKLSEYIARSEELRDLGIQAAKRLRRLRKNNRVARRWKKRVRKQHRENLAQADKVPLVTSSCS